MTRAELKHTIQDTFRSKYGFAPSLKEINLLEVESDGTEVYLDVNGVKYNFTHFIFYSEHKATNEYEIFRCFKQD